MTGNKQTVCGIGLDPIKMGKFFEKIDNIDRATQEILIEQKEQNGRVGKLEKWKSKIIGIGIAVLVFEPFILKYIFKL